MGKPIPVIFTIVVATLAVFFFSAAIALDRSCQDGHKKRVDGHETVNRTGYSQPHDVKAARGAEQRSCSDEKAANR
jgi:hypothetical protein